MAKILDELNCFCCGTKLSKEDTLFETAWSGVYWCGRHDCAISIMEDECEKLDAEDSCCHED